MKKPVRSVFLVLWMMTTGATQAAELTEETVRALLARVDSAVQSMDASGVARELSDDVVIILNLNANGRYLQKQLGKQEYVGSLRQNFQMMEDYEYSQHNVVIRIEGNTAYVTADVKESMTIQGRRISAESREETTIEMVNGVPRATKIVGYTRM